MAATVDRQALLTALTTEHFTLQGARSQTVSESAARSSMYMFSVSGQRMRLLPRHHAEMIRHFFGKCVADFKDGQRIGSWELVSWLGEGGARRSGGLATLRTVRKSLFKVLKPDVATADAVPHGQLEEPICASRMATERHRFPGLGPCAAAHTGRMACAVERGRSGAQGCAACTAGWRRR
jgi:hypothetical protein